MFISKLYKSQAHYAHGATMCTSACIFWVVGCLQRIITPLCSIEDMDVLMKHAADVHSKLVLRGQEGMLQQHEIFQATRVPENIDVKELGVYSGVPDSSFPTDFSVHVDKIPALCVPDTAIVLTGGRHTSAFVHIETDLFCFDSLRGEVCTVQGRDHFIELLHASHGACEEMTLSLLTRKK